MANAAEDFISKFHSLEGTTLAQRRKNFFTLLHKNASLKGNTEVLDAISTNLTPKSFLESLFKLDFLIHFRRTQELLQLLKQGNDVFVSKIAKQVWFFKESFDSFGSDELVNEVFPCMSFSVRMKVLRKLSRYVNDEQFDKIFHGIVQRYGIFLASNFITGCSPATIRQTLKEYPIKLTNTQLKILYKKEPSLIEFYFTHTKHPAHSWDYRALFKFLFSENRNLYDQLKGKYSITLKFGRRTTKKIVDVERNTIIENPHSFLHLNMKAIIRKVGKDSTRLFCNALPPNIENLNNFSSILQQFPKKYHYHLYVKTVEKHYNIRFSECSKLIDERLLKLIPDNSERALLAKVKVDEGCDNYLKYLTTQDSIPRIKEKINLTSDIYERGQLTQSLVQSCHINNDTDALAQVIKYFCFRHKNDEMNVHLAFIRSIETLMGFKKFNEEMWNHLNDLLTIHMLKYDTELSTYQKIQTLPLINFNRGTSNHQKLSYLEFLFDKNQPIDELILEFFTTTSHFPQWGKYGQNFEKYFLLFIINNAADCFKKDCAYEDQCSLIGQINKWNSRYADDQISFYDFPSLVNFFNNSIRNDRLVNSDAVKAFKSKIFNASDNTYKNEYLQIYWERFDIFGTYSDLRWFLKHEPLTIVKNFDESVKKLIEAGATSQLKFWYVVKKLSHLQLDDKSVQYCVSRLSDDDCLEQKPKFITCISAIMKPEDYVAIADKYKPANKALDLKNETEVRLYNLQCSIAQNFKNTKSYEVLPSLLNYCAGDYFKYSLRSLYSILYRTPENLLPQYLNYLSKKAVSVRKHALYLTCELNTSSQVERILKLLNQQEGVQSIQKHMFATAISYFVKNPLDQFFEMVKTNMLFISKADDESLNSIVQTVNQVPTKYKAPYLQYSWDYLEKTVDIWEKLRPLKENLLRSIDSEASQVSLEFGLRIIQQHFFVKPNEINPTLMKAFMFNFLVKREEKTVILQAILQILDQRDDPTFFQDWYGKIMSSKADLKYLAPYVSFVERKLVIIEDFPDYVKLFLLKTKLELAEPTVEQLSTKIFAFLEHLTARYGPHVLHLFSSELGSSIDYFTNDTVTEYHHFYHLVKSHPVPTVAMVILNALSQMYNGGSLGNSSSVIMYNNILRQIKGIPDDGVQINLLWKFKSYLNSEEFICSHGDAMEI